ncbi:MAG: hypothetical protein J6A75_12305 [Lachnospiraceae bacterium]|nr:hypothetical protein [Lachnospiraceae bacterium]
MKNDEAVIKTNTHLNTSMDAMERDKAKYDKNVKELLADPQILARILEHTVEEVEGLSVDEIINCLDKNRIEISSVAIDPGMTNVKKAGKVEILQTEDAVLNEGYITFDIKCALYIKTSQIKVIINVEAQKSSSVSTLTYHLENRIVFYLARLISSQKGIEFINSEYDNIKKVYSIWICMDATDGEESIHKLSLVNKTLYGNEYTFPELDKMCGVVIRIRKVKNLEESKNTLIAMLEDLLADEQSQIKKEKLVKKYNMEMTTETRRRIDRMCNLSDVVLERGLEKGIQKGIQEGLQKGRKEEQKAIAKNMFQKGIDIEQISILCMLTPEEVKNILEDN